MVRAAKLLKLGWHNKRLRYKIEILQTLRVLHPLDVLVQAILPRQFVGAREMVYALVRTQRSQDTLKNTKKIINFNSIKSIKQIWHLIITLHTLCV